MNKASRFFLCLMLSVNSLALSGCWDNTELNKTSLITGVALEPGHNGKLRLTIETMIAGQLNEKKESVPSVVQSMEGNTLAEIVTRFNESLDRNLLISHVGVIIVDERLARQGLSYILDPLQRTRYIREDVLVLVSEGVHASQILKVLYPRGAQTSSKIVSQVESYRDSWGGIPESRLYDVSQAILADGRELTLGSISLKGPFKDANLLESIKSVTPKASVILSGAGVFSGDKLLGFITLEESRMVLMARNQVEGTTLSIPGHRQDLTVRLLGIKSGIHAFMDKGKLKLQINLEGNGLIGSVDESIDITQVSGYDQVEKLASEYLEEQMTATIQSIQKRFGVDVFGFGEQMYRKRYKQFLPLASRWNEIFANTPVTVKAKIKLRRSELKTNHIKNEGIGP
ncbi:Ger(x)C family spore germination protein [Paenibacillus sp. LPE1-1-1.1]|uniref:Ger(x)C family spore germination protein n=1 Tax=Paenibacillus sp. LPE1-1-1.1 TaxID=3135230 RepID=UPI0034127870